VTTRAARRPAAERRRELAEVAAAHFHRLGFHGVALADVAAEVGITAPAVYRHFRNKNALLAGAIATGLDHVEAALSRADSLDGALEHLAEAALRRRDVWVLLQREVRHLDDRDRDEASARFRRLVREFTAHVAAARPDLDDGRVRVLATGAFAVLASPSTQPLDLPHEAYRDALLRAATAVGQAELPPPGPPPAPAAAGRPDLPRAEQVLATAIALFHRHGYAAVSMDDIGAAAGIAGPSIYHHFPTKAHLLIAAHERAAAQVPVPRPEKPVRDLVERYAAVVVRERELFGVHVTEGIHLPAGARQSVADAAGQDVRRWVAALRAERPELTAVDAELLVHAARSAVHDIARIGRLHSRPRITDEIVAVASAVLGKGRGTHGVGPGMTTLADRTIAALRTIHDDLAATVPGLSDAELTGPSGAAEWPLAQVLSHLGSGAEIALAGLTAALTGTPPAESNQDVWDRWNAKGPRAQATDFLDSDAALVAAYEALTAEQRETLAVDLGFLPAPLALASVAGMRLNEAALHAWDVRVALDPAAALPAEAAQLLAEHLSGGLAFMAGFLGRADVLAKPATVDVAGSGFALTIGDGVAVTTAVSDPTATFAGPLESAIRLIGGRLTAGHTPNGVTVTGDVTLDDLRKVFPGF